MPFRHRPDLAAAALTALDQGVLLLDGEGAVVACNPAAARLLGRGEEELVGTPLPGWPVGLPDEGTRMMASDAPSPFWSLEVSVTHREEGGAVLVLRPPAEGAPTEDEIRLREFVDHAPGVFFVASADGNLIYTSPGMEALLGRGRDEILHSADPLQAVHPDDRAAVRRLLSRRDRAPYEITYRAVWPNGTVRWIRQRGFPVTEGGRETGRVAGMLEDITDQRAERELLTHTLRLLRQTVSSLQEGVLVVDTADESRRILSANPAARRIFGCSSEELVGESVAVVHPDESAFLRFQQEAIRELGETGVFQGTYPLRRVDGTVFPAAETVAWLDPEAGPEGGVVLVVRDLSDQRRAEAELRASEERFRLIAERIDDVFWISDPEKEVMEYVSPAYAKVWGRDPSDLLRDPTAWMASVVEEDRERVRAALPRQATGGYEEEYRIRRPDGGVRWIWDRAFPVEDGRGRVTRIIGVAEDITERKRAEERFGALSREISDVFYILDEEGRVRFTSPSVRHALGWEPDVFEGRPLLDRIHPEDRPRVASLLAEVRREPGAVGRAQYRMGAGDGDVIRVESIARNLLANPAVEGVVLTTRDVTERLELEEQLLQVQKMEAVGRLAGGIAHDFNNLLTVIRAETDLLLLDMEPGDPLREEVRTIQATGDRAAELTNQLLAFSREQVLRPRVVDLGGIVAGMGTLLERIIGEDVVVVHDLPEDLPPVRIDPAQMEHVIMNLAVNARDAMPRGGTLTLETGIDELEAEEAGAAGLAPGPYVFLRVTDTGVGMSEEVRQRIFDPFFTTKPQGEGTGLGLAMAHGVVRQSGGDIHVRTAPGEGSAFTLRFPALKEDHVEPGLPTVTPDVTRPASGRILLVEDDDAVRRAARKILERAGLEVDAVGEAEGALESIQVRGVPDLLLTDLVLPGMSGRALVEQLGRDHPSLPVVVMSGYAGSSPGTRGDLPAHVAFVQKPFVPEGLVEAVRQAMGTRK